ncbi:hypothetical protein OHB12_32435 [Nocardia sp. NBC_01730]|uniref:hypothetical protein n=1 Tax=Nocardia sp. NBC_01730 TaxID=2975998 RepID=UPI002E143E90|nr:hypothetical protein OHB12_32435 [Nocardia sp. NBC_01730]
MPLLNKIHSARWDHDYDFTGKKVAVATQYVNQLRTVDLDDYTVLPSDDDQRKPRIAAIP